MLLTLTLENIIINKENKRPVDKIIIACRQIVRLLLKGDELNGLTEKPVSALGLELNPIQGLSSKMKFYLYEGFNYLLRTELIKTKVRPEQIWAKELIDGQLKLLKAEMERKGIRTKVCIDLELFNGDRLLFENILFFMLSTMLYIPSANHLTIRVFQENELLVLEVSPDTKELPWQYQEAFYRSFCRFEAQNVRDLWFIMNKAFAERAGGVLYFAKETGINGLRMVHPLFPRGKYVRAFNKHQLIIVPKTYIFRKKRDFYTIRIDSTQKTVSAGSIVIHLTKMEYSLFTVLHENINKPVTRLQIIERIWGRADYANYRTVDVYIRRIRKKIKQLENSYWIETVRDYGYILLSQ